MQDNQEQVTLIALSLWVVSFHATNAYPDHLITKRHYGEVFCGNSAGCCTLFPRREPVRPEILAELWGSSFVSKKQVHERELEFNRFGTGESGIVFKRYESSNRCGRGDHEKYEEDDAYAVDDVPGGGVFRRASGHNCAGDFANRRRHC